jgi:hypothetical protein
MFHIQESFNHPVLGNHHVQVAVVHEIANGVGEMSMEASLKCDPNNLEVMVGDAVEYDMVATLEQKCSVVDDSWFLDNAYCRNPHINDS